MRKFEKFSISIRWKVVSAKVNSFFSKCSQINNKMSILNRIEALEKKLLIPTTRKSLPFLEELLSNSFQEFGQSGNVYRKQDILKHLPNEEGRNIKAYSFDVKQIDKQTYLVTYITEEANRRALRSSIWSFKKKKLQMIFHQGTSIHGSIAHY